MDKNWNVIFFISLISLIFFSCSTKKENLKKSLNQTKFKNNATINYTKKRKIILPPPPLIVSNTLKKVDPLEVNFINLTANNSTLKDVLYVISKDLGMNLIISPDVDTSQTITANFNNTPAKVVLSTIEDLADVYFYIKNNVLYVKKYKTKVFKIPYIHAISNYNANLGGDVLGSGIGLMSSGIGGSQTGSATSTNTEAGGGSSGNLQGNFQLNFESPSEINDFYNQLEDNIKQLLSENGKYSLNRFTGVLVITDTIKTIKNIEKLINKLKKEIAKQVLIEAKIIEVQLFNESQYGIDWSALLSRIGNLRISASQTLALGSSYGQLLVTDANFSAIINALANKGKIETLSNPRIRVLNGESAIISSGTITPFWEKQIQTIAGNITNQQIVYVKTNVLDGILLGVSPYINDDGTITLNIIPVSTKIRGTKQLIIGTEVQAEAPILDIKEAGTTIKVKDGSLVIIGGLITKDKIKLEKKLPLLGDIPYLGSLFKSKHTKTEKKELIIFLKPKIIKNTF